MKFSYDSARVGASCIGFHRRLGKGLNLNRRDPSRFRIHGMFRHDVNFSEVPQQDSAPSEAALNPKPLSQGYR